MKTKDNTFPTADASLEKLLARLKPHLPMNQARLRCFAMLVLAVIGQRTVSLVWLSKHPNTRAKSQSVLRRFERFFAGAVLRPRLVGSLILALAPKPPGGWVLAMDRTNWKFGKQHINILTVTVLLGKVGLPVAWLVLPKTTKRGNPHKRHRIKIMEDVLAILPAEDIRVLAMDREFVGKNWLGWLRLMEVCYIVRVRRNTLIGTHEAGWLSQRKRWKKNAGGLYEVFGQQVHFAAKRIARGRDPYLAVISWGFKDRQALELYRLRWGIETFFSHLKKRGYNFEDSHMSKARSIEKMMGILAVAFAMCYHWGCVLEKVAGVRLKKHGHRAKSIFRQGFESIHAVFKHPKRNSRHVDEIYDAIFTPNRLAIFVG